MEQLYLGMTVYQGHHGAVCAPSYDELYERLDPTEQLLSRYHFMLNRNTNLDLFKIHIFAKEIGAYESFLEIAQIASTEGVKIGVEELKPKRFVRDLPGYFNQDCFVYEPAFKFSKPLLAFRDLCVSGDLMHEIASVIKLFFSTGRVLVEKTPKQKIVHYWEN